ncbi:MAG: ETC complex I subunit [Alphaproteobacteria bacterium]
MTARIFQPTKTAMQSGRAKTHKWVLEFELSERKARDPLMGWTSSGDTRQQLCLEFASCEEAVAYAKARGIAHVVVPARTRTVPPKSYSANFSWSRIR